MGKGKYKCTIRFYDKKAKEIFKVNLISVTPDATWVHRKFPRWVANSVLITMQSFPVKDNKLEIILDTVCAADHVDMSETLKDRWRKLGSKI